MQSGRNQNEQPQAPSLRLRNHAPSPALAPYVDQHYILTVVTPDGHEFIDTHIAETALVGLLIRGDLASESAPGEWTALARTIFAGPNTRPLRVRVRGGFHLVWLDLCPAAWRAFTDVPVDRHVNRFLPITGAWGVLADVLLREVEAITDESEAGDAAIFAAVERHMTALLDARGWPVPNKAMHRFERLARSHSTAMVRDLAGQLGINQRNLERKCHAHFGMSPKTVLRRNRFLDVAAAMRGFARPGESELAALHYYDQPHLIREFRQHIGMTPGQFEKASTPLLDARLRLREARKAEEGGKLAG